MPARVIILADWKAAHPQAIRTLQAGINCWQAWARCGGLGFFE